MSEMTILAPTFKSCVIIEYIRQGETSSMRTEISTIVTKSNYWKSNISDDFTAREVFIRYLCEENDVSFTMHMHKQ